MELNTSIIKDEMLMGAVIGIMQGKHPLALALFVGDLPQLAAVVPIIKGKLTASYFLSEYSAVDCASAGKHLDRALWPLPVATATSSPDLFE